LRKGQREEELYQGAKEAAQSAFRMLDSHKSNIRDMQEHLKIYKDFQNIMNLHPLLDTMPIRYDFDAQFEVIIHDREGWDYVPTEQGVLIYYTDGSRKDGLVGIGIYGPSIRHYEALGSTPTIFQAEMYAINVCARKSTDMEGIGETCLYNVKQPSRVKSIGSIYFQLKTSGRMS
jgi:hypothetical protein